MPGMPTRVIFSLETSLFTFSGVLKKPVEPAPAGRAGVARVFCGRIETAPFFDVLARPGPRCEFMLPSKTDSNILREGRLGWAGDTHKPLPRPRHGEAGTGLDRLFSLFQHPVNGFLRNIPI